MNVSELQEVDHRRRPQREMNERPRHRERDDRRPGDRHQPVVAGVMRDDAENLARCPGLGLADGLGDADLVVLRNHLATSFPTSRRRRTNRRRRPRNLRRRPTSRRRSRMTIESDPLGMTIHGLPRRRPPGCAREAVPTIIENTRKKMKMTKMMSRIDAQSGVASGTLGGALLPFLGVAGEHLGDVVDPARDPAGKIVGAEPRQDRIVDDETRHQVGQRAFEAVADLDADLALVRRHDQQHAVVLVLLSDLPVAAELIAVILDRGALQRFQRDHHHLVGRLGFKVGELLRQCRPGGRIEDIGLVDHPAGQGREGERCQHGECRQRSKHGRGDQRHDRAACSTSPFEGEVGGQRPPGGG